MKYLVDLSDKRNVFVYNNLKNLGKKVGIFSFSNLKKEDNKTYEKDAGNSKFRLNRNYNDNCIIIFSPAKKIFEHEAKNLSNNSLIFGGNQSNETLNILKNKDIKYVNMLENADFVIENAKLTAEGILALLINSTEKSIFKNKIIILGSGRVGMATATLLYKLNLIVDIAIFHNDKLTTSSFCCQNVILKNHLNEKLNKYDVIINTVPFKILEKDSLSKINENAIILEIASINCLDEEFLKDFKFKYIKAPALPQRFSAESAAEIMLKFILEFIKDYEFKNENNNEILK